MFRAGTLSDNDGEVLTSIIPHRPSYEVKSRLWTVMVFVKAFSLHNTTTLHFTFKDIELILYSFAFHIK
jgi:hypothetical protein